MDDIYRYLDYREYLRDHFNSNKKQYRYFSFRYVAGKTGLDASFYVKILNKQKHIANTAIPVLCTFLKLQKPEATYFSALVQFNKAKTADQESLYLQKILLMRKQPATHIDNSLNDYFSVWWNVAIREALKTITFTDKFDDLATRIYPPISAEQAQRSVKLLLKLGLAEVNNQNHVKPVNDALITSEPDNTKAMCTYQKSLLKLASSAIDKLPKEEREISTLTVVASHKNLEAIRKRLYEFSKDILELTRQEHDTGEVYQINFQIFPVTRNGSRQ